jgi:hypothetical protein
VPHISPDEDPHSDITELNDEEDDKSDTEDDALPDFFTEYWDVLEEEKDETVDI